MSPGHRQRARAVRLLPPGPLHRRGPACLLQHCQQEEPHQAGALPLPEGVDRRRGGEGPQTHGERNGPAGGGGQPSCRAEGEERADPSGGVRAQVQQRGCGGTKVGAEVSDGRGRRRRGVRGRRRRGSGAREGERVGRRGRDQGVREEMSELPREELPRQPQAPPLCHHSGRGSDRPRPQQLGRDQLLARGATHPLGALPLLLRHWRERAAAEGRGGDCRPPRKERRALARERQAGGCHAHHWRAPGRGRGAQASDCRGHPGPRAGRRRAS
mmetsp:Transcript_16230/g.63283  ORF Transcript_16230/g.63283 Transcript_16230/m.63283 type:complete len:271 (-) Transcript_16230:848-1660(-)